MTADDYGETLNHTETTAYAWLQKNFNLKPEEVEYRPEFPQLRTKGGKVWGPKLLYFGKAVQFYPGEVESLLRNVEKTTLLLFENGNPNPVKQIPAHIVKEVDYYEGIKFHRGVRTRWSADSPTNGEILLPVTRRDSTSRYWRVEHAPIESLTVWRDGEYRLEGPSMVNGKMKFFLVLRPVV